MVKSKTESHSPRKVKPRSTLVSRGDAVCWQKSRAAASNARVSPSITSPASQENRASAANAAVNPESRTVAASRRRRFKSAVLQERGQTEILAVDREHG